jgi:hypothetical protein
MDCGSDSISAGDAKFGDTVAPKLHVAEKTSFKLLDASACDAAI